MSGAGSQRQFYELTVCAASGFASAPLGGLVKPKFFLTVQNDNATLVRTPTSERTLTPEWNTAYNLLAYPNQVLKFELFRDSSVRNIRSVGSFETTMGQLEQLQTAGKLITQSVSEGVILTLRCRQIDIGPSAGPASQTQTVHEPEPAPEVRAGLHGQQALLTPRGPSPALESRVQTSDLNLAPDVPTQSKPTYGDGSRTFALVIGIDAYSSKNKPRLQGAANDARNMHHLLMIDLNVPESHICLLCNEQATRDNIIKEFQALASNPNIRKGDAIIIYYAGHGSRAPAPPEWLAEGDEVETICPVDEEFEGGPTEIHGIPDKTIGALVHQISVEKGENIVLIFDCCHSGGIARGDDDDDKCLWRSAETTVPLPVDLDKAIWEHAPQARGGARKAALSASLSNYVLLAACQPKQKAMETIINGEHCGAFSTILARHLRRSISTTTYSELMKKVAHDLQSDSQNPICEGRRKCRPIFDGLASRRDVKLLALTQVEERRLYTVDAGAIHGISKGYQFGVGRLDPESGAFIEVGLLEVETVSFASCTLRTIPGASTFDITDDFTAIIEVRADSDDLLDVDSTALPERWIKPSLYRPRYRTATAQSNNKIILRDAGNGRISFERGSSPIADYMKERLLPSITFNPSTLQHTLNSIGDFHYHLARNNPIPRLAIRDKVKLGIHRLSGGINAPNLFSNDGRVTVTPGEDFFFSITNESPQEIFPYLFFFDSTEYSIQDWYSPPQQNGTAPLPACQGKPSVLQIGFNDEPFEFTVPEGATRDLGFVKLFISTCEVDMDSLIQDSPFLHSEPNTGTEPAGPSIGSGASRGGRRKAGAKAPDSWDACCYTVDIRLSA